MSLETNSMHRLRAAFARMAGLLDGRDFAGEEMRSFASACHDALAEVETDRIDIIPRSRVHAWSVCLSRVADRLGGAHGWDPELGVIVREMQAEGAGGVRPSDPEPAPLELVAQLAKDIITAVESHDTHRMQHIEQYARRIVRVAGGT